MTPKCLVDAQKGYAGTSTIRNARSLWFPFHSPGAMACGSCGVDAEPLRPESPEPRPPRLCAGRNRRRRRSAIPGMARGEWYVSVDRRNISNAFSRPSTPRSPMEWGWDCRSAGPSRMAAGCGQKRTNLAARYFSSPCPTRPPNKFRNWPFASVTPMCLVAHPVEPEQGSAP